MYANQPRSKSLPSKVLLERVFMIQEKICSASLVRFQRSAEIRKLSFMKNISQLLQYKAEDFVCFFNALISGTTDPSWRIFHLSRKAILRPFITSRCDVVKTRKMIFFYSFRCRRDCFFHMEVKMRIEGPRLLKNIFEIAILQFFVSRTFLFWYSVSLCN